MEEEKRPYLATAFWCCLLVGFGVFAGQYERHKADRARYEALPETAKVFDINRDGLDEAELRNFLKYCREEERRG